MQCINKFSNKSEEKGAQRLFSFFFLIFQNALHITETWENCKLHFRQFKKFIDELFDIIGAMVIHIYYNAFQNFLEQYVNTSVADPDPVLFGHPDPDP